MEQIKRILWGSAAVIALCIFALMMLVWWLGGVRRAARGAVLVNGAVEERSAASDG